MNALNAYFDRPGNAQRVILGLLGVALALTILRPWLPDGLVRIPESWLLPWRDWIDAVFQKVAFDWGLINVTRTLSAGLEFILDAVANVLYGRARWPRFEALPWTTVAAVAAALGYFLGGWRLALLAGGTFFWAAMIGQWKFTMETLSVIVVAAPFAFLIGGLIGILSWKSKRIEDAVRPLLLVMKDGAVEQIDTPDKIVLNPATEYVRKFTEEIEKARVVHAGTLAEEGLSGSGEPVDADATILSLARRIVDDKTDTIPVQRGGTVIGAMPRAKALDVLLGAGA